MVLANVIIVHQLIDFEAGLCSSLGRYKFASTEGYVLSTALLYCLSFYVNACDVIALNKFSLSRFWF